MLLCIEVAVFLTIITYGIIITVNLGSIHPFIHESHVH